MLSTDEAWLSATDAFYAAAIDGKGWYSALAGLAAGTGSRIGELIGIGSDHTVPFNWVTDLGQDWLEEFIAIGGGDPNINPFVRGGTNIPVLRVVSSAQFLSPEERRTSFFMNQHAIRHDLHHICLTPLVQEKGMLVGLAVIRSGSQGEIDDRQRAVFASIAPHVRAAVRAQMALEHQGALVMANALEALSLAVFVCDRFGAVKAMTPAAETFVARGDLRLRQGRLSAADPAETRAIQDAITLATHGLHKPGAPVGGTVPLRTRASPLLLEVVRVPARESAFGFDRRALVVVRGAQPDPERMGGLLRLLYGLTAAESEVALGLASGQSPEAVAATRRTSVGTVRAQIRTLYAKLHVNRQSELVSKLNQLR